MIKIKHENFASFDDIIVSEKGFLTKLHVTVFSTQSTALCLSPGVY